MFPFLKKALNAVFPPLCLSCGKVLASSALLMCEECIASLDGLGEFVCSSCGKRVPDEKPVGQSAEAGKCHAGSVAVFAAFRYESLPARRLIHALKYSGTEAAADTAARLAAPMFLKTLQLARYSCTDGMDIVLVPIPLSPSRMKKRGFNQSLLFTEAFLAFLRQKGIRVTVCESALRRIRDVKSQTACKTRNERASNVAGCFEFTGFPIPSKFAGYQKPVVFLVDDVVTSGATIEEAARTLRKAKVPRVAGLCIAKT